MNPDEDDWLDDIFEPEVWNCDWRSQHRSFKNSRRSTGGLIGNPCREILAEATFFEGRSEINIENKEEETMTKLYKAEIPMLGLTYVTLIGRDGADYVVKVSDTGNIAAVKQIIEVMPNTVGIRFNSSFGGGAYAAKTYSFIVDDLTKFSVGDLLIPDGSTDMATVVEVDSKSSVASKKLTGRRVMTEAI
jgi:hypothetical protein